MGEKGEAFMNERSHLTVDTSRHPGRAYLLLGILSALAGPGIYFVQVVGAKVLMAPWYVPLMATAGVLFLLLALVRSRSVTRWVAVVCIALLAAAEWGMMLVELSAPAYTGPVKAGQPFPAFTTTLANGSSFTQNDLTGEQNTVLVFYRGWW
jgi:hypothetical protein